MGVWTCPNTECIYDDQLQAGQFCPMCGEEAREFSFNEFGGLLRNKEALRKSVEKSKEYERISRRTKFCPNAVPQTSIFLSSTDHQSGDVWTAAMNGHSSQRTVSLQRKYRSHTKLSKKSEDKSCTCECIWKD